MMRKDRHFNLHVKGDVRSCTKDSSGDLRFAVYFEDKNLKQPVGVKPGNLHIVFDLPSA